MKSPGSNSIEPVVPGFLVDGKRTLEGGDTLQVPASHGGGREPGPRGPATGEGPGSEVKATGVVDAPQGTTIAILVSGPGQFDAGPIPSDATATVRVGAIDDSGTVPTGVAGEPLEVTITRPDSTTESFSVTTDSTGAASRSYDLSGAGRGDGVYDFTVTDPDASGVSATTTVRVGPKLHVMTSFEEHVFTGEQTTFEVLLLDGESPVQNESISLEVSRGGTTLESTSDSTDSNGFASVSYEPSSTGQLTVDAERNGQTVSQSVTAVDRLGRGTFDMGLAKPGETCSYCGYVETSSGYLTNTDVVITIQGSSGGTLTQETVTTDGSGFFVVDYTVPDSYSDDFLLPQLETTDGQGIPLVHDFIAVNHASDGGDPPTVQLSTATNSPVPPGGTLDLEVEATDGGTAINGQDVEVFLRYAGGPPLKRVTLTTGSDGTATTTITLPGDAPDGHAIGGIAVMDYDGSTYDSAPGSLIRSYNISHGPARVSPGTQETVDMQVVEQETSTPVQGVPMQLSLSYGVGRSGSIGTAGLRSGSDGTDQTTIQIPSDVGFRTNTNAVHRYRSNRHNFERLAVHPGSVGTNESIVAGEATEFSFSGTNGNSVHGIAFAHGPFPAPKTFATRFQGPGTFSLPIPSYLTTSDGVLLTVWAIDDSGTLYSDEGYFGVDSGAGTIAITATADDDVPVGGEASISISAESVDSLAISDLWTDWSLTASSPDGGSVSDDIDDAGEVTIAYGSDQSSVSPSITVSLPNRYLGGAYGIEVSGTNSNSQSADASAVLTIE